jgi:hypothetical protein
VAGKLNAGGIVGQNEVDAVVRRCYSTAAVTVEAAQEAAGNASRTGAGGIAGYNAPGSGANAAGRVEHCAALNPSITTGGLEGARRVAGEGGGVLSGNYAWAGMPVTVAGGVRTPEAGVDRADGADCEKQPPQSFYEGLGWNFATIWETGTGSGGYPVLKWETPP